MSTRLGLRHAPVLVALLALLSLAGCGSDGGSATGGGTGPAVTSPEDDQQGSTSYPTQARKACDVLTEAIAQKLLGQVSPATTPSQGTSSDDISVSTCVRTSTDTSVAKSASATLLMRVARNATGAQGNRAVFDAPPPGAHEVEGYGDKAFWNPAFGQLNILSDGNWYILTLGPIDQKLHTLEQTRKLADALKDSI
jgi:hypothetical protein